MAHFILEHSDNIPNEDLALQELFKELHKNACNTGLFTLKGIRSRAYPCTDFRVADGNPNHMFVHLTVKIGAGREQREKDAAAKILFATLEQHFAGCFEQRGVALSFELRELDPHLKFNKNNIADYIEG